MKWLLPLMEVIWITILDINAMALDESKPVPVNFCCPPGEILSIRRGRRQQQTECTKVEDVKSDLEGKEVKVKDIIQSKENNETELIPRKLTKLGVIEPKCGRGLSILKVNLNDTYKGNDTIKTSNVIELWQYGKAVPGAAEGNVYIYGSPICDDKWDKFDARVACRMLGFADGTPTTNSKYGPVDEDMELDDVECRGNELSLYDCDGNRDDNCSADEGAGVICSDEDNSAVYLTVSGSLSQNGNEIPSSEYCLTDAWKSIIHTSDDSSLNEFKGILALSCDRCEEEVLCHYLQLLFRSFILPNHETIKSGRNPDLFRENMIRVGDQDKNGEVDFKEFKDKFVEYLTVAFRILDRNNDNSIDEVLSNRAMKEYSFDFFEHLLNYVLQFFDSNEDDAISGSDFQSIYYSNGDEYEATLSEIIGFSPINLPAPLYTAYTLIDVDQNEIFTREEISTFLRSIFSLVDKNQDSFIDLEELLTTLEENDLPREFLLAVQIVGQQYLALAKFLVDGFIEQADANEDGKITLDEVVTFSDFGWIDESIDVAITMGYPSPALSYIIGSPSRYSHQSWRHARDKAIVAWLTTLNNVLDEKTF